jgi:hypothetical protein
MSDSDYRQHMAEYFRMRAEGSSSPDYSPDDNHPTDGYEPTKATPSEIEWGAEGQYEPTTNYSLDGYTPIDSVVVEAPLGHGVAFDLGAEGRPYPDASVPDIFEDLPRQNAEISGVDFQADAIIEGTEIDSGEVRIEPLPVQEGRSLEGYTAMDSVVEQAPLGYGVPQWYGRAEGSAGDQVVSWEDGAGVSSPSSPPSNIMWAEGEDELDKMRNALKATVEALNDCMEGNPQASYFEDDYDALWENHDIGNLIKGSEQGYNDKMDESMGMRHRGRHEQSLKDRRDEASAMDKRHSRMGRKYDDVSTMDAESSAEDSKLSNGQKVIRAVHDRYPGLYEKIEDYTGYPDEEDPDSDDDYDYAVDVAEMVTIKEEILDPEIDNFNKRHHSAETMDAEGWGETCGVEDRDTDEPCTAPATVNLQDILMEYEVGSDPYEKMHLGDINKFFCKKHYDEMDDMWAETKGSEHHKGQGYDDELDESLGMSHKESGMKQSFKDRRDESKGTEKFDDSRAYSRVKAMDAEMDGGKDWNMGLTQYAGSAGGSGAGTPVSYGGIALPESAVAELVESSSDNPLDASMGTVMGTMGAETALARKKSKNPSARQRGRAATQGTENDPCAKSDRACPKDKALWQKSKQRASKEYRVWPSPHASAYAVQLYNDAGGKWKGASKTAHPAAKKKNLGKNSLGNYYGGKYERKGDKGKAVDFSDKKTHVTHGDCGRAYTKDMSPAEFRKSFPRCLPQSGAAGMTAKGQKKETLNKRARLNKRKFRGGKGVSVPVDRKAGKKKK